MSGEPRVPKRLVACPGCGTLVAYSPGNPWRPFCSERCRQVDLGAWASETYRIPLRKDDPDAALGEEGEDGGAGTMPPRK